MLTPLGPIDGRLSTKVPSQINTVNGIDYYINSYPVASLAVEANQSCPVHLDLVPLTVMNDVLTAEKLYATLNEWLVQDDVISHGFFKALFLPDVSSSEIFSSVNSLTLSSDVLLLSSAEQLSDVDGITYLKRNGKTIPNGPYFVSSNFTHVSFYHAYRLYPDYTNSFMYGIVPTEDGKYETLRVAGPNDNTPTIAVPSRLYYTITNEQPLAGLRLGVKDIYDIAGTKRGCGNRAYFDLYPVVNTTVFAIQKLIDNGAILVGKAKTSQFANGETATGDWVDYHCPFNPRGDGYQQPASSTSSAASLAAYDWLDIIIGSDTGGSIREPAAQQGIYGIRPSHGAISFNGVMPLSAPLDTAGFFARDPTLFRNFAKTWYGDQFISYSNFPQTILYSVEFFDLSPVARDLFQNFANQLSKFLGSNGTTLFNVSSAFTTSNITNTSLEDYYCETYMTLVSHYQYYNLGINFINDYKAAYDGRTPFINPVPKIRWQYGSSNVTNATYNEQLNRKNQFLNWWNNVVQPAHPSTCSENIFLYPVGPGVPSYRNQYLSPAEPGFNYSTFFISPFASNPDIAVPVDQVPYNSTITQHLEYLPISVGFIAHVGCDYMLLELIKQVADAGILKTVKTGRVAF